MESAERLIEMFSTGRMISAVLMIVGAVWSTAVFFRYDIRRIYRIMKQCDRRTPAQPPHVAETRRGTGPDQREQTHLPHVAETASGSCCSGGNGTQPLHAEETTKIREGEREEVFEKLFEKQDFALVEQILIVHTDEEIGEDWI